MRGIDDAAGRCEGCAISACWRAPWRCWPRPPPRRARRRPSPGTTSSPSSTALRRRPISTLPALRQQVLERSRSAIEERAAAAKAAADRARVDQAAGLQCRHPVRRRHADHPAGVLSDDRALADAMVHSSLLPYTFLIVGHIDATGRRENNALLSQRRADAVRDILVNTFKISAKRLQSVGLGEEQLLDPAHPNAPVNNQMQILTVSKVPEQSEQPAEPTAPARHRPQKSRPKKDRQLLPGRLRNRLRVPISASTPPPVACRHAASDPFPPFRLALSSAPCPRSFPSPISQRPMAPASRR